MMYQYTDNWVVQKQAQTCKMIR